MDSAETLNPQKLKTLPFLPSLAPFNLIEGTKPALEAPCGYPAPRAVHIIQDNGQRGKE